MNNMPANPVHQDHKDNSDVHPIQQLLNNPPPAERRMYTANIFHGKNIIASIEVMAKHEQEAVIIAAKSLDIQIRKSYDRH